ncbi:MAG: ArsR/SmtB family transcription factor [Paracoccaceae bacterium]
MKQSKALDALSALANKTRLDIVRLLVPLGAAGMAAGEIGRAIDVTASRLSFHLAILEQAKLLTSHRKSRNVYYSVDHRKLGNLIGYLLNDCCGAHPAICACTKGKMETGNQGFGTENTWPG